MEFIQISSLDYLRLVSFAVVLLILSGVLAGRSPANFFLFPWISLFLFLSYHLYASSLMEIGFRLGLLLSLTAALGIFSRFAFINRSLPFAFIFFQDFTSISSWFSGFRPGPGFSYLAFRMSDAFYNIFKHKDYDSKNKKRIKDIHDTGIKRNHSTEENDKNIFYKKLNAFILQTFAFTALPAGPVILSGQFRINKSPFRIKDRFYRRGVFLFCIGILKLMLLLPLWTGHFEKGLLFPVDFSSRSFYNIFSYGFYQYIRIFLDFSGYTDIAVGLSALLGFKIRHNFFRPYLSVSLSEFWRRWHITLASWIRRHVYIPMGGSRRGKWTQGRNLIFCMVLIGIWHGTGLHFFAWGLLHGIFLFIEKAFLLDLYENFERKIKFSGKISGWIVTQMFVTLTWAIFFIK